MCASARHLNESPARNRVDTAPILEVYSPKPLFWDKNGRSQAQGSKY